MPQQNSDLMSDPRDDLLLSCIELVAQFVGAGANQARPSRSCAEEAFVTIYDRAVKRVYGLVRRFISDEALAQEITEDVFFLAWTRAASFDPARGNVLAWLLVIARSHALDAWRQQAAQKNRLDAYAIDEILSRSTLGGSALEHLEAASLQRTVQTALARVTAPARQMLSLAFFQGMTHSEISHHLGLPLGTVKTTIRRGLLSLRAHLDENLLGGVSLDPRVALAIAEKR
jgi:RNA polymerase sigma-70 factor, ECF subfamily